MGTKSFEGAIVANAPFEHAYTYTIKRAVFRRDCSRQNKQFECVSIHTSTCASSKHETAVFSETVWLFSCRTCISACSLKCKYCKRLPRLYSVHASRISLSVARTHWRLFVRRALWRCVFFSLFFFQDPFTSVSLLLSKLQLFVDKSRSDRTLRPSIYFRIRDRRPSHANWRSRKDGGG